MLRVIVASCASDPLVACNVSCESPVGVLEADAIVNVWDEFAATVIGDTGLVDVPAGRPDIDTETDPLNPFNPTMATVNGTLVLPCTKLADVDENGDTTDTEKSGAGGGGVEVPGPPPQAIIGNVDSNETKQTSPRRYLTALSSPIEPRRVWADGKSYPSERRATFSVREHELSIQA